MNSKAPQAELPNEECRVRLQAIRDTTEVLRGKWKLTILNALKMEPRYFMDLQRHVAGIGAKMLSTELQHLELNELVKRTVYETKPITVKYELTEYGRSLKSLIEEMEKWGLNHRKHMAREI